MRVYHDVYLEVLTAGSIKYNNEYTTAAEIDRNH